VLVRDSSAQAVTSPRQRASYLGVVMDGAVRECDYIFLHVHLDVPAIITFPDLSSQLVYPIS
jgi:hypothetical protein